MRSWVAAVGLAIGLSHAHAHADTPAQAPSEFIEEAKQLLVVGSCADGEPKISAKIVAAHCKKVKAAQEQYKKSWIAKARPFFETAVPKDIPKTVVYPFAGGDLSTALTVFPDADEITTLSLEPAGDPRALTRLSEARVKRSLDTVATEIASLYKSNFSRTMAMIGAMRGGQLPTQLIFSLSALWLHGYEPTSLKYFQLTETGDIRYLTAADFERIDAIKDVTKRNKELASMELRFRKQGTTREQTYRHIMANLHDAHLKKDPAALLHVQKKGKVAAMTKAASFLLSFDEFSTIRKYLTDHVEWMVSDASGVAPKWGKPAGFEYETYGAFERSEMDAGEPISPSWVAEFKAQPRRPLKFRFGYPDVKYRHNLIIMRKPTTAPAKKT